MTKDARTESRETWLSKVYGASDQAALKTAYDGWADTYDEDVSSMGFTSPGICAGLLGRYVPAGGKILDAGAGTGRNGALFAGLGYGPIVALDLSPGMLKKAAATGAYAETVEGVLGEKLDLPDNAFDGTVAIGVFTLGHAPPAGLEELCRVTKPGGHVIITVSAGAFISQGFDKQSKAMEDAGHWRLVEITPEFQPLPQAVSPHPGNCYVWQVK